MTSGFCHLQQQSVTSLRDELNASVVSGIRNVIRVNLAINQSINQSTNQSLLLLLSMQFIGHIHDTCSQLTQNVRTHTCQFNDHHSR